MSLGTRTDPARQAQIAAAVAAYAGGAEKVEMIKLDYGISSQRLIRAVDEAGVKRRTRGNARIDFSSLADLVTAGNDDVVISRIIGCSRPAVVRARQRLGIQGAFPRGRKRIVAAAIAMLAVAGQAQAHEWYTGLKSPTTGGSCCNMKDCAPAPPCTLPDGKMGLTVNGTCYAIPWNNVLAMPSPDGQSHACLMPGVDREPRCVILGGSA